MSTTFETIEPSAVLDTIRGSGNERVPELRRAVGEHRLVAGGVIGPDLVGDRRDRRRHAERLEEPVPEQLMDRLTVTASSTAPTIL